MLVVWSSKTGNVKRFISKLGIKNIELQDYLIINEPFVIITYTTGFGLVPQKVIDFLENNHFYLRGVASSGNRNWHNNFALAADKISQKYGVPIIHKFELSGTNKDVETFIEGLSKLNGR